MAYSNINKDNLQVGPKNTLKTILLIIVLSGVIVSSLFNIYNQWSILRQARSRNQEMEQKIARLETENKDLTRQIEYATSSANISRKTREYLGLGSEEDYWLIMPQGDSNDQLKPEINETVEVPTIIAWWNLFTK
jgi:cell division protein FtsL